MAYGDFTDLARRTASDKVLRDKAFNIAKNPKYDGYERGLSSMVCKYFDKNAKGSDVNKHANDKVTTKSASFRLGNTPISWAITQTNY